MLQIKCQVLLEHTGDPGASYRFSDRVGELDYTVATIKLHCSRSKLNCLAAVALGLLWQIHDIRHTPKFKLMLRLHQ